jgi:hypothetical protein
MTIADLLRLAQNRLAALNNQRSTAEALGYAGDVARLEAEITETENTIAALNSLL